ncbi:MAG: GatB/YqeY domain-containing protein, partial [Chloroflexota bacterium]
AIRSRDETRKRAIRMALSGIKLAEVEKGQTLDESALLSIIQKEVKSNQETIVEARRAGREDMIATNEAEIAILREFLPKPLTTLELEAQVLEAITEIGAKLPSDMGKVMNILIPRLEGRANGNEASEAVRKLLQVK